MSSQRAGSFGAAPQITDEALAWWARARLGLAVLVELARSARPYGIRFMAIKGAHVQAVASRVSGRPMADVDAMLVEGRPELFVALLRAGALSPFGFVGSDEQAIHVARPGSPFVLDVHVRPFPAFFARLSCADLRRRALAGGPLLEGVVEVPDPLDGVLLALVHYAKDRLDPPRRQRLIDDLAVFDRLGGLDPGALVSRTDAHHVRALVVFALSDVADADDRLRLLLEALRPSGSLQKWLGLVRRALATDFVQRDPRRGYWLLRAVRDDWRDVFGSLGWQAASGLGRRWRKVRRGVWIAEVLGRYAVRRTIVPRTLERLPLEHLDEVPRSTRRVPLRLDGRAEEQGLLRWLARVDVVARMLRVPDTCLYRAAARYVTLRTMGVDVDLVLGVRASDDAWAGHAWTEHRGRPMPAEDVAGYRESLRFPRAGRRAT